jgi:hypothetical protein
MKGRASTGLFARGRYEGSLRGKPHETGGRSRIISQRSRRGFRPPNWRIIRCRSSITRKPPPNFLFTVSRIRRRRYLTPELVLSGRLAISAGVLSSKKPIAFTNHGFILEVPENNILTTSPSDQWFDNYAVRKTISTRRGAQKKA